MAERNPAQEGIDAAKREAADGNLFGEDYVTFIDLQDNFKTALDCLVDKFKKNTNEIFPDVAQQSRLAELMRDILLNKGVWM